MTIRLGTFFIMCIAFFSCTEVGPPIDFGTAYTEDTTYIASVESPQQKNILIEEFTGVSCPPCPSGHDIVKAIKSQHSGRVIVVAYHILNFPQAEPIHNLSKQDFRTQDATDIGNAIFNGIGAMPLAGIDRIAINNDRLLTKGIWPNSASQQVVRTTALNINLNKTYNEGSRELSIIAKISFTEIVEKKLSINIMLIEDSIIDAQKNQLSTDTLYTHNYVLRDIVTPISGNPFLDNIPSKEPGRVYERKFTFTVHDKWVADKCKIVAFVNANEPTDKEVLQAIMVKVVE